MGAHEATVARPHRAPIDYAAAGGGSRVPQQEVAHCTGGHFIEPYEQKTQQSPGLGRSRAWQFGQS
jgi:hypothetical protein